MRLMLISALMIGVVAAVRATQQGPPRLSPEAEELQKRFPYPLMRDQRGVVPPGPRPPPSPPLGDGPWVFSTFEQRDIRVSVVTKGLSHPWSLAFLPDGSILITERVGRLRVVRNGVLDPTPVPGTPQVLSRATMAGLMDIALHPDFARNNWIYISYHKPLAPGVAANAVLRGTWDGNALTDVHDVFVSDDVDTEASRIVFGKDGMLYVGIGGPGTGPHVSVDRAQHTNDLAGKVLRLKDDGSVPPDNPFVGGLREGEVAPSGQLQRIVFNDKWEELRRESLLRDLHQRIRDVRQGSDGLLYLLTDEDPAALVRIEPVAPASSAGATRPSRRADSTFTS